MDWKGRLRGKLWRDSPSRSRCQHHAEKRTVESFDTCIISYSESRGYRCGSRGRGEWGKGIVPAQHELASVEESLLIGGSGIDIALLLLPLQQLLLLPFEVVVHGPPYTSQWTRMRRTKGGEIRTGCVYVLSGDSRSERL